MTWCTELLESWIGLDTEIQAAFIGVGGALIGGIVGGALAGIFTVGASDRSHRQALQRDERERAARTRGVLLAIRAEVETIKLAYNDNIGPEIRKLGQGQALQTTYNLGTGYFTIYEANAGLIGNVADADLRKAIVVTYTTARSMLDSVKINDGLIADFNRFAQQHAMVQSPVTNSLAQTALGILQGFVSTLKKQDEAVMRCVDDLLSRLPA